MCVYRTDDKVFYANVETKNIVFIPIGFKTCLFSR